MVSSLVFYDLTPLLQWPPQLPELPVAEAAVVPAIKVESFDQDVTTDGSTFDLNFDVGATSSAFVRLNTGTRKTSAGPTGSTANAAPNVGTVGLVLTDTNTVTVERVDSTSVKVMGEVWRYEGSAGGGNEFIVRDRVELSLTGSSASAPIAGVTDVDKVVPFITGYTVDDTDVNNWEAATIAAHMDDSGDIVVSRNNAVTAATVYVDIVEFTGANWQVCHGYSNSHNSSVQTITLNTDSDGQGGSTCDVTDWSTAAIIEATMEGDSAETGLSDTLALVRPGGATTEVIFDILQDGAAQNDGEAWIHVLQNDDMVVSRASSTDFAETDGSSFGTAAYPAGATTTASIDTLSLEWFSDTSGTGIAHMRGGLHARITDGSIIYNDGDTVTSTQYDSTVEANFTGEVTFAASPSGVIYEAGGTGTGAFVGYNDGGDFIIRAGNGASVSPADAARIVITSSNYDFSNRTGTLAWNFFPDTESVDLSFDEDSNGSIDFSTSTTAASAWANWSGGNDGNLGNSNANIAGSEITSGYDFNGTLQPFRFTQGGSSLEITHWVHRNGNTVGVDYGVIELSALPAVTESTFVSATSSQASSVAIPSLDTELGGTFIISEFGSSRNVTDITLTESGTIDAQNGLDNIEVYYDLDTTAPYNCVSESFTGTSTENQYGATDTNGFSGADGISSFTESVAISTTQTFCGYVVYDVTDAASDADTIEISINDPSVDVLATGGASVGPESVVSPVGSTTARNAELTQTNYRWLEDDGGEGAATAVEAENTPATGFANATTRRLRLQVDAAGSTSSPATTYQLDYATKTAATCGELSTWVDVGAAGGAWDMAASQLTEGADSTNIGTGSGGVSDPSGPPTYLSSNGALRDVSSQTGALTLDFDEFVEFEFGIEPTVTAPQGNTYCFRLSDSGTELRNYTNYAEGTISADISVSATGTERVSVSVGTNANYQGGGFVIERDGANRTVTDITIREIGTIDEQNDINDIRLYYDLDTTVPLDCTGESYDGGETQFGATSTAFSVAGTTTFSGSQVVNNTQSMCLYVFYDVGTGAVDGETIDIEITDPSTEVVVSLSSVGPSSAISPTGSTTVSGPVITQTSYRWRNNDGTEITATAAQNENTPLENVAVSTIYRARVLVDNTGGVGSQSTQYRLEYGTKITTCSAVASWQDVDVGTAFDMASTSQLVDGNDTTDISTTTAGIENPSGQTFQGTNGGQKEDDSVTSGITLSATQFTELEYAILATADSGFDTTYCFRVTAAGTPLPSYSNYPELTTREKQDFFVQRGSETVTGSGLTLTAGVDYTAPSATSAAFVRISNSHMTGAANNAGTDGQQADDVTAYISDQSDITSSFTISRPPTASSNTRVSWEIIEFVGLPGSDNEMIVRGVGEVAFSASTFTNTGAVTDAVTDDDDVVVFITGQSNDNEGTGEYNDGLFTASWASSTSQASLQRGDADVAADVSYAVVEFTGLNWQIQRVEHVYTSSGVVENESITAISGLTRAFVHAQKRVGEGLSSIDEGGHLVYISSIGAVSFELRDTAQTPADHTSVAWVIENTQSGTGAMTSYRTNGTTNDPDPEPATYSIEIDAGSEINTANASIWGTNHTAGTGTTYPRLHTGFTIASSTNYEIYRSDTNNDMTYRVEVIEWPVAQLAFEQNYYRFYVDNDAVTPTDVWPVGASDLGENTSITGADDPLGEGERVRIRMSLQINNASFPESTKSFKLQFGRRDGASCSAIATWTDIGAPGGGEIWRGADGSPVDGVTLPSVLISVSDITGTYEEENNTAVNPAIVDINEDIEYDWLIEHNGATQRSDYCFRMVESDGTLLAAYNNYPTLRTTGYTPIVGNWRWYGDETSLTPSSDLGAENVAPTGISNQDIVKLRVTASEVESAAGSNVKFLLQYSQDPSFASGGTTLTATSSCSTTATWCYADGAGVDNALIDERVLSDSDACSGGSGAGCGTHNEAATTTSSLAHPALGNIELEFTLQHAGARANAVYYFRLVDAATEDALAASSSYPSLVTEGAQLIFSVAGLPASTVTEGVTTDVATTPTSISFGSVPLDTEYEAAHRLAVDTNATEGYQVLVYSTQDLLNSYSTAIDPVATTNLAPAAWSPTACLGSATGCFGYHAGDDSLAGGSTRFFADDRYAAFDDTPREVMHSSIPVSESHDMVYKIQITDQQPAGDYEANIVYLAVPVF
ncbi:MAG: hypothetical protein AAGA35_00050 [Patescibacteria group bacterium]